jgi:hypothetical protein
MCGGFAVAIFDFFLRAKATPGMGGDVRLLY